MRGRRLTALLAAGALAVAGCGGDAGGELAPQTPGAADMPLPESPDPPGGEDGATDTGDAATPEDDAAGDDATEPDAGATGDAGDTGAAVAPTSDTGAAEAAPETAAAVPETTGGGATAPESAADGPGSDTPPPAGSDAEQFEDFCAQNPGAC